MSIRTAGELHAKFGWRWCQRRPLRPSAPRPSIGALARCPARPRRPRAPQPGPAAVCAACCCLWPHGCSGRRRARPPARLGVLTSFGAAPRSPPVPSGPSGALHTSGAWLCCVARRVVLVPVRAPPPPTGAAARPAFRSSPLPSGLLHSGVATKKPRFCLLIRGIALLREALHYLVASALLAYLVHRFLTQRIPAHAHGVCG